MIGEAERQHAAAVVQAGHHAPGEPVGPVRGLDHVLHVDEQDAVGVVDDVGVAHRQRVPVGEVEAPVGVDGADADQLRELDQVPEGLRVAARVAEDHHRPLRPAQLLRERAQRSRVGRDGGRSRGERRDVVHRHRLGDLVLLQPGVQGHVGRSARSGGRDAVGAGEHPGHGLDRAWLVVPLGELPDRLALDVGRVDPVDVRPATAVVGRSGPSEDQHGHAVDVGVVDAHRPLHQPDQVVQDDAHRTTGGLGVAVRQADGDLLVRALDHLHLVARVVHQRVVQPAEGRARVQRDVRQVQLPQGVDHDVGAPDRRVVGGVVRRRRCSSSSVGVGAVGRRRHRSPRASVGGA